MSVGLDNNNKKVTIKTVDFVPVKEIAMENRRILGRFLPTKQ